MCLDCYASMIGFTRTSKGFVESDETEFLPCDVVVLTKPHYTIDSEELFSVEEFHSNLDMYEIKSKSCLLHVFANEIRTASIAEIQANRRLTEAEQALAEVS
ncbi:hypothetical protein [Acinetobacter guillouiae]|uniref:hypothetical protein n=1 Tax=Acinetobacter guillouiae TaxID=106649 RepID=UPI0026E328BB|nr:hypothetical protein [Acinetobacter guillouiae]MDO6644686.1 hypothetical protein [Acinetobacter guillouiae]